MANETKDKGSKGSEDKKDASDTPQSETRHDKGIEQGIDKDTKREGGTEGGTKDTDAKRGSKDADTDKAFLVKALLPPMAYQSLVEAIFQEDALTVFRNVASVVPDPFGWDLT